MHVEEENNKYNAKPGCTHCQSPTLTMSAVAALKTRTMSVMQSLVVLIGKNQPEQ